MNPPTNPDLRAPEWEKRFDALLDNWIIAARTAMHASLSSTEEEQRRQDAYCDMAREELRDFVRALALAEKHQPVSDQAVMEKLDKDGGVQFYRGLSALQKSKADSSRNPVGTGGG